MSRKFLVGLVLLILGGISSLVLLSISKEEALGQFLFALVGFGTYVLVLHSPRRLVLRASLVMFLLVLILLGFTYVRGHSAKGASRWFSLGPIRIQSSELAKPVLALTLAVFAYRYPLHSQRRIGIFLVLSGLIVGSVFIEPDLGSSLILLAIAGGVLFVSVPKLKMLLPWAGIFLIGILLSWNTVLRPYQKERLFSFIGQETQSGSSYNAQQSVVTVGSGKLLGRGIGHGVQTSLRFLPEHHTDFFFASFAEETGFIGVLLLFTLYGTLFWLLWWDIESLQTFDRYFRFALIAGLFFQFAVHVAMNIKLVPVTGIPLPFLSSGGSSFISLSLFLGLGMRFSKTGKVEKNAAIVGFASSTWQAVSKGPVLSTIKRG